MAELIWDASGSRTFENGLDRGVIYLSDGSAVPWNGLIDVDEDSDNDSTSVYFDGRQISELVTLGGFKGKIKAFTYPDVVSELEGMGKIIDGLLLGQQRPKMFSLGYRTKVGNDLDGDAGYKIHLLYNVTVVPGGKTYTTNSDDPEAMQFEWQIAAIPEELAGFKPTAYISLDSRTMNPEQLADYEAILYGTASTNATLIPMSDFVNGLYYGYKWKIIDNGDGTFTAITPDEDLLSAYGALILPGTAGAYASSPDNAKFDIVGDIDLRVDATLPDWTSTAGKAIFGKWGGTIADKAYILFMETGRLQLYISDGSAESAATASADVPFPDGTRGWVRVTYRTSDRRVQFFTSIDGDEWTQLGTNQTHDRASINGATTHPLMVGGMVGGATSPLTGTVYKAEIRNGIDGDIVASPDFTVQADESSFEDGQGNVWTVNGTASIDIVDPDIYVLKEIDAEELAANLFTIQDTFV